MRGERLEQQYPSVENSTRLGICSDRAEPLETSDGIDACSPVAHTSARASRGQDNSNPHGHHSSKLQSRVGSGNEVCGDPMSAQPHEHFMNARTGRCVPSGQENESTGSDGLHVTSIGDSGHGLLHKGQCRTQHKRCKFWYAWVVQTHSVSHCPRHWQHPMGLLLKYHTRMQEDVGGNADDNHRCSRTEHGGTNEQGISKTEI